MIIFNKLAGYSLKEADDLRRIIGKKKKDEIATHKQKFLNGCAQHSTLTKEYSINLWDTIVGFADYCLVGSTKVKTLFGNISIQEIVDQKLKIPVYCLLNNKLKTITVTQWHDQGSKNVWSYMLENGTTITCTNDHKFMTTNNIMLDIDTIYNQNLNLLEGEKQVITPQTIEFCYQNFCKTLKILKHPNTPTRKEFRHFIALTKPDLKFDSYELEAHVMRAFLAINNS